VEYALRSAYESTIGRLSEASAGGTGTDEDGLAARVAQQYVDFIRVDPWYLFDFVAPLQALWSATPWTGPHLLRKWERRYLLSTEWLIKAGYAWLIKLATGAIYDPARPLTAVVLNREPSALPGTLNALQRIGVAGSQPVLVTVPRYDAFMAYAQALADQGVDLLEIAGNHGPILVSVLQRTGAPAAAGSARTVLVQPILTRPGWERQLVALPVPELAGQLRRWRAANAQLEARNDDLQALFQFAGGLAARAHDRASLDDLLDLLAGKKLVLIDTAGMAQRDQRTRELLDMLAHRAIQRLLVVNAASQGETIEDVMLAYGAAQCRGAVLSKIDEAVKIAPALDALIRHKLRVVGVANGQRVPEDWHRLSSSALVQRAMRPVAMPAWRVEQADMNLVFAAQRAAVPAAAGWRA